LNGRQVEHDQVLAETTMGDDGASLAALQHTCRKLGLDTEVWFLGPKALDSLPLPAVAHLGPGFGQVGEHFVLLVEVGKDRVTVLDGSTGRIQSLPKGRFETKWSGYVLVRGNTSWRGFVLVVAIGFGAIGLVWGFMRLRTNQPHSVVHRPLAVAGLLAFLAILVLGLGRRVKAGPPATLTADKLIGRLTDHAERFKKLPGLIVDYRMDREVILTSPVLGTWAFEWGEGSNAIRPGQSRKLFTRFRHPERLPGNPGGVIVREEVHTLDDTLLVRVESSTAKGKTYPSAAVIMSPAKHGTSGLPAHIPYFKYLGYVVIEKPEEGFPPRAVYPKDSYWLPDAVIKNRGEYVLDPEQEQIGGVWCHVLQRPGFDKLWVQTEPGTALRRRQVGWGQGKPIRENMLFDDFVEVASGLTLPRSILYEVYAAATDDPKLHNRVCYRLRLRVSKLSVEDIPDSQFRARIPPGSVVDDLVSVGAGTRPRSFVHKPSEDPFAKAVTTLEKAEKRRTPWFFIFLSAGALVVLAGGWWWRRRWLRLGDGQSVLPAPSSGNPP
jgi:hypothetical protein